MNEPLRERLIRAFEKMDSAPFVKRTGERLADVALSVLGGVPVNVKITRPVAAKMLGVESKRKHFECASEEAEALYLAGMEPAEDPTGATAAGQPWWWIKKVAA